MEPQAVVAELVKLLVEYGGNLASKLAPIGLGLTGAFLVIKLAWEGITMGLGMRSANEGFANILFTMCIGSVLATMFLPKVGIYSSIIEVLSGGFDYIALALTDMPYSTSQLENLSQPLMNIITALAGMVKAVFSSMKIGWSDIPGSIVQSVAALITLAYLILVLLLYLITFAVAMIFFLMATITFAIGVAFGPILIPLVLFKPLEEALSRWFWFVMSAGMSKIMILVLLLFGSKATTGIFEKIKTAMAALVANPEGFAVMDLIMPSMSLTICALLILVLMLKAESITNALLPGHGAMGLGGFMRAAASVGRGPGAAAKSAGSLGGRVGGAASSVGSGIGKGTGAALRGMGNIAAESTRTGKNVGFTAGKMAYVGAKAKLAGVAGGAGAKTNAWLGNPPTPMGPQSSAFRDKIASVKAVTRSKR